MMIDRGKEAEGFTAFFRVELFDFGYQQGLGVWLKNGQRHAVRIRQDSAPKEVAEALRFLAQWIEGNS